jgi:DNA-binding MarR family transcriptional regulator
MIVSSREQSTSDLAIVLTGAARVVADRLGAAVEAAGIDDMRTPFGFVIRALAERGRTLTELASMLDVSKQAAIKVVDEMEARGFLRREPYPDDRRRKVLTLTEKGRAVRQAALAASHEMERELRGTVGDADVDAMHRALLAFLAGAGADADADAGRSRALW